MLLCCCPVPVGARSRGVAVQKRMRSSVSDLLATGRHQETDRRDHEPLRGLPSHRSRPRPSRAGELSSTGARGRTRVLKAARALTCPGAVEARGRRLRRASCMGRGRCRPWPVPSLPAFVPPVPRRRPRLWSPPGPHAPHHPHLAPEGRGGKGAGPVTAPARAAAPARPRPGPAGSRPPRRSRPQNRSRRQDPADRSPRGRSARRRRGRRPAPRAPAP